MKNLIRKFSDTQDAIDYVQENIDWWVQESSIQHPEKSQEYKEATAYYNNSILGVLTRTKNKLIKEGL